MTTSFTDAQYETDNDTAEWPDVAAATDDDVPAAATELSAQRAAVPEAGDEPDHGGRAAGKPSKNDGRSDNKTLIRRAAQKALDVAAATDDERRVLSGILGSSGDTAQLVVEVLTAPRGAMSVVSDLEEVSTSDPMEAGVLVASWPKPRVAALWSLLSDLGAVKGSRPGNEAKAALALAKAAQSLPTDAHDVVGSVVALARKN